MFPGIETFRNHKVFFAFPFVVNLLFYIVFIILNARPAVR